MKPERTETVRTVIVCAVPETLHHQIWCTGLEWHYCLLYRRFYCCTAIVWKTSTFTAFFIGFPGDWSHHIMFFVKTGAAKFPSLKKKTQNIPVRPSALKQLCGNRSHFLLSWKWCCQRRITAPTIAYITTRVCRQASWECVGETHPRINVRAALALILMAAFHDCLGISQRAQLYLSFLVSWGFSLSSGPRCAVWHKKRQLNNHILSIFWAVFIGLWDYFYIGLKGILHKTPLTA